MEKWILASDIHIPKHDPRLLTLFLNIVKDWKPDAVDLVGDIDDAEGTSRWADGSTDEVNSAVATDAAALRAFSADLRAAAGKSSDLHWHDGNHGWTRHNNYIKTKAKALDGLITPDFLYDLDRNGITFHHYSDPPVKRFGDMHVHHGVAISKHSGQSVKSDVEDWNVSLIRGHSHRLGTYFKTVVFTDEEQTITQDLEGYEIGHLCKVSAMKYTAVHNWQAGFAIAHVVDGRPHVQLVRIMDYQAVVDGKLYKG